LFQKWK